MEPTIMQGDGYLLVPAGTVESGDILTFYSDKRGEYATHRVVKVTEDGFVTQGDNNPSTDQSVGYPLVTSTDILGKVATIGKTPVVFPQLGVAIIFMQTNWKLGLGGLIVLVSLSGISENTTHARDVIRFRTLLTPLVLMAIIGSSAALVLGAPTAVATFSVTNTAEPSDRLIPANEPSIRTINLQFSEQPEFTHQFIEAKGMTLTTDKVTDHTDQFQVRVPAQSELGPYRGEVRLYRYPASLPYWFVASLQAFHPGVAAVVTMSTIFGPIYLVTWLFVDGKTVLHTRSRRRSLRRVFK